MLTNYPGNRKLIRAINRSNVLNSIKKHDSIARTDIARELALSPATISAITAELIEDNLVFEKEAGDSKGGRRPILLAINPKGGYVIGFKLTEDNVTGVLTDLKSTVIANITNSLKGHSTETVIRAFEDGVEELLNNGKVKKSKLLGVGIGLAGIVDSQNGILRHSPILGWSNVPLGDLLKKSLGVPVTVDNDVNTLTFNEQWYGIGQGIDNFLTVTIGRGVGLGMVVNGQLYRGPHGSSGEFGHTVMDPDGPICDCGNRGCLEALIADPGLIKKARTVLGDNELTMEGLMSRAQDGDDAALRIYSEAGNTLAWGIANLINVLSPGLIIISGEGVRAGDYIFEPMRSALPKYVMPGLGKDTEIQVDTWDDNAWARGAAGLVLGELFLSPLYKEPVSEMA